VRPWRLLTQDIANPLNRRVSMAEREQPRQPTHRAYSVIRREGQEDFWLNLGLVFDHKDGKGFNIMLQASHSTARSFAVKSRLRTMSKTLRQM
jgi:hypothetical protein